MRAIRQNGGDCREFLSFAVPGDPEFIGHGEQHSCYGVGPFLRLTGKRGAISHSE